MTERERTEAAIDNLRYATVDTARGKAGTAPVTIVAAEIVLRAAIDAEIAAALARAREGEVVAYEGVCDTYDYEFRDMLFAAMRAKYLDGLRVVVTVRKVGE